MAGDRLSGFSSAFDEALASNRRQLDELLSKSQSGLETHRTAGDRARQTPGSLEEPVAQSGLLGRTTISGSHRFDSQASATVRRLNERFGDGWRYDIAENFRDADEFIVRCQVTLTQSGVRKSQFGSARIGDAGGSSITGAADGVDFSLQLTDVDAAREFGDAEHAAFQQAVEAALARCEQML